MSSPFFPQIPAAQTVPWHCLAQSMRIKLYKLGLRRHRQRPPGWDGDAQLNRNNLGEKKKPPKFILQAISIVHSWDNSSDRFKCLPPFSPSYNLILISSKNPKMMGIFKALVTGALRASPASPSLAQGVGWAAGMSGEMPGSHRSWLTSSQPLNNQSQ